MSELPALDYGQDDDELLQDIAAYYSAFALCPICGAEMERTDCEAGCDEGLYDAHALYPLEYAPGEMETCECCGAAGHWWTCPNTADKAHAPPATPREP